MTDCSILPSDSFAPGAAPMPLLSRKGILAIAAVIDVAINSHSRPVSARALAMRHKLPPRHLEPVLQALVREGILRGVRGPHGGYTLAREHHRVSANDILRAIGADEDAEDSLLPDSPLANDVVKPALVEAERTFSAALARISVEDMAKSAQALK